MPQQNNKTTLLGKLRILLNVNPSETKALVWAWLYVFAIFLAYYVLRPIRDELGVSGGVENLPWLFTGTLVAMIAVNPLFAFAVKRWTREKFIAITYRFFMLNLLVFLILIQFGSSTHQVWIGRAFFIWVSVFNLFVISVFWSFIVDIFNSEQGKRLFGILASGATIGGIAGSALTSGLVEIIGQSGLLMLSALLLEAGVFAVKRLSKVNLGFQKSGHDNESERALGGGVFSGMGHTLRSPYLFAIAFCILLSSIASTFLYFQQAEIVSVNFTDKVSRTAFFANIDFWVNTCTLFLQLFFTGYLVRSLGVALMLCVLPFINIIGFSALATYPVLAVFVAVQIATRVGNFGLSRPVREVLFTTVSREDRYKAKNFIDTVIYRTGDQVGSWAYAGLIGIGLTMTGVSIVAVPLSLIWLGLSFWLGRQQHQKPHNLSTTILNNSL
ncbi:NTP/NDP exchange transporter [Flavobacterium silvaticum]|uniref:MFS transporter n=1 Tax=Flavobacterium silvaticum TaxID=1852020 RepID=A0A972FMY4_9FLAO|nr:MFS transporter [Flavobacterium silvaticum]NMH28652.1 MFS transporter [Flavobacterium silvaticum]